MANVSVSSLDSPRTRNARFPRGILKSAESKRILTVDFPEAHASMNGQYEVKKASFADEVQGDARKANMKENKTRLLQCRRWSNPDALSSRRRREKSGYSKAPSAPITKSSFFNPYEFYIDKFNDNNALIMDSQRERIGRKTEDNGEEEILRHGFRSQTSIFHTQSKIVEWMRKTSRNRHRYDLDLVEDSFSLRRLIMSAGALSKTSSDFPSEPRSALSRKESFLSRVSRRVSLFGHHADSDRTSSVGSETPRVRNFRWYCRVIKAVCGLKLEMQKLSISKTQQANLSEILYISAGARAIPNQQSQEGGEENQFLLFDKSAFSRGRARSKMPLWAQSLMIEPPNRRPNEMVHKLRQLLMNMKSFRENITENMRHTVCKVVRYTKCDKGRVILRQGHWGFDFYFIFSGSVFIQLELFDERTGQSYPSVENVLKSGEGFGEIAILGDGKRTASVICKEPTELCQIDKETFLEICPALFNELLQEKIRFARQFPIFSFWDEGLLKKLCFLSQVLDVPHSTVLEMDWSKANFAYFVMKGRITLVKSFDATGIDTACSQERSLGHFEKAMKTSDDKTKRPKYAKVGTLSTGTCSDLSILSIEPRQGIPPIVLLSQGAKVFRVAVRTFFRMSPRKAVEEYLKKVYVPMAFPSNEELRTRYHMNISWAEFKKNVVTSSLTKNTHHGLACIPATMKGTTGWAKWPGYHLRPKSNLAPRFGKDRLSPTSDQSYLDWNLASDSECLSSEEDSDNVVEATARSGGSRSSKEWLSPLSDDKNQKPVNSRHFTIPPPPNYRTLMTLKRTLRQPLDSKSL